jgi:hypothetical protein
MHVFKDRICILIAFAVMPDLIRHPEGFVVTGFLPSQE